jgi:hypothetical protein
MKNSAYKFTYYNNFKTPSFAFPFAGEIFNPRLSLPPPTPMTPLGPSTGSLGATKPVSQG